MNKSNIILIKGYSHYSIILKTKCYFARTTCPHYPTQTSQLLIISAS